MLNGGSTVLAASETFDLPSVPLEMNVLTPSGYPQAPIDLAVLNAPGNASDWVGLYTVGAGDASWHQWMYLNGSTHAPGSGFAAATLRFVAPSAPGSYEFRLFLNNTYARAGTSAPVTVLTPPSITIDNAAIVEGNSGTATAVFTVSLAPAISQPVTVRYATANGTAASGSDYVAASGTLTFDPSMTTRTISVAIKGDATFEQNETFFVNLSQPTNATVADPQGAGTIVNDDEAGTPAVTAGATTVLPGATITATVTNGPGNLRDWVGLYGTTAPDSPSLDWSYLNGTTIVPEQALTEGALVFTAPTTPGTYHFRLFANNSYTRLATSGAIEVAAGPTLRVNDISVTEGNAGTAQATFTVTLSPVNTTQAVTVSYVTSNGSATAGSDYVAASGTVTFDPSTTSRTISVAINGDTTSEQNETFFVNLSQPVNAVVGDAQGTGTITNDDATAAPLLSAGPATLFAGATITATVTNGPGNPRDWLALAPTAASNAANVGWFYLNGTRNPPAQGLTAATVVFTAPATPGRYEVRLFANDGYTRLATSGTIEVVSGPILNVSDVSVTEGNSGTLHATFTVTLSPANPTQPVTVNYATANGTAVAGSDYVAASGTLTFAPSVTTQTITVTVLGDTTNEQNETFAVNLSGATNAPIGDAEGVGTIVNDDVPPTPTITPSATTVSPGAIITFTIQNGPANPTDWVGFYRTGNNNASYVSWVYLNGSQSPPSPGLSTATVQFIAPTTPGTYEARFFVSNGWGVLATSSIVTVAP
jgi:chitinase